MVEHSNERTLARNLSVTAITNDQDRVSARFCKRLYDSLRTSKKNIPHRAHPWLLSQSSRFFMFFIKDSSCFINDFHKSNTISARFHMNSCAEDWLARLASVWAPHSHSLAPHSSSRQTCISIFRIFDNHDFRKHPSFPVASGATGNAPRVRRGQGWTAGSISENHIFRYQVFYIF